MEVINNFGCLFVRKLHIVLLVLFVVGLVQFVVVFHVLQIKNDLAKESQLVELLQVVNDQNRMLRQRHRPVGLVKRRSIESLPQVTMRSSRCESVHMAVVCGGATSSQSLVTMLKSVLFYRRQPLQLHLVVDAAAERSLRPLFSTWRVADLTVHFYNMTPLEPEVSWIRNTHYSGKFGLIKLTLIKALPKSLAKVISIDTDLVFNVDIAELWQMFRYFGPKQALGLVENQSNFYLRKRDVWPALKQGFNTGLVMMDLDKLRQMNWSNVWNKVAMTHLRTNIRTQLADQDIINAALVQMPGLHYVLPCQWNVQLNVRTDQSDTCIGKGVEVKVVHWNSRAKQRTRLSNRNIAYFRQMLLSFVAYDGSLLRKAVLGCPEDPVAVGATTNDSSQQQHLLSNSQFRTPVNVSNELGLFCGDIVVAANTDYRTHMFYLPYEEANSSADITFVTQLSLDRILMLENLATQWTGHISAAVFASDAEVQSLVDFVATSPVLRSRRNIAYHIVYKESSSSQGLYPVNYLRNVAMDQVSTDFIMLADVDFAPKMKMREYINEVITSMKLTRHSKVALVIPPFETSLHRFPLPITKRLLLTLWERNLVLPFRFNMWKPGQLAVNFSRWKMANDCYQVEWTPNFEPYFVISRDAPRYDTRFVGFGWNKVAHSMVLNARKYQFLVLPEAFLVHLPHSPSISNSKFRLDYHYRSCMQQVKNMFLNELNEKYNITGVSTIM